MGAPDRLSIFRTVLHFIKQQNWAQYGNLNMIKNDCTYNFNKNQQVHYVQYVNLHIRILWFSGFVNLQMTICFSFISDNKIWNHLAVHFFALLSAHKTTDVLFAYTGDFVSTRYFTGSFYL